MVGGEGESAKGRVIAAMHALRQCLADSRASFTGLKAAHIPLYTLGQMSDNSSHE